MNSHRPWLPLLLALLLPGAAAGQSAGQPGDPARSRVVEAAGVVEFQPKSGTNWLTATNGLGLQPGDRLRTGPESRAAVQFSDRSVFRLGARSNLEIQPPRQDGRRRFQLQRGLLFFFNRERPADVEFETPLTAGAIRGTEFVLAAEDATGPTRLALLDGRVELLAAGVTLDVAAGEEALVEPGKPPRKTALIDAVRVVQWALYYPAILAPADLDLPATDAPVLAGVLSTYLGGNVLGAQAQMAAIAPGDAAREQLRAALELAVGRVDEADRRLGTNTSTGSVAPALRELIQTVRHPGTHDAALATPATATEFLARTYTLQARYDLRGARDAARAAVRLAPDLGYAHARQAELEWALDNRPGAEVALDAALRLAPHLAQAHSLRGFFALDRGRAAGAVTAFDAALREDAALGSAWLGRGLALLQAGRRSEALVSLQTAVALEPRRALHRSYLGKAWSQDGLPELADKEFRIARELDPADPTAWFYAALKAWQYNRPNVAVRDLSRSTKLNDNRQVFRSRLDLDRDRAVRSANQAAIYNEAGLPEVGQWSAARAVENDYANYSAHLFLANSYQSLEDPARYDLRYETARQSELLLANLLAPAGVGTLSPLLSQPEHLQFTVPRPVAFSSFTEYRSSGDWIQQASLYGALPDVSYALDVSYESQHGEAVNDWRERTDVALQLKQRVGPRDEVYFQIGFSDGSAGDVARHYDPDDAHPNLRVEDQQTPNFYAGWHRAWSPSSHTLFLFSRLSDRFNLDDPNQEVLFLRYFGGRIAQVSTAEPGFGLNYGSDYTLYSADLQHLWQWERHMLIVGGRFQAGQLDARARLDRELTGPVTDQSIDEPVQRADAYTYYHWQVAEPLRLIAGVAVNSLTHPVNSEIPPLNPGDATDQQVSPKAAFLLTPWKDGLLRGSYSRSLGGVLFDNSIRLEPVQLAGFNQAYRSLLPETVSGPVPGTDFNTFNLAFDQTLGLNTYFGLEGAWLFSDGSRVVGALTNVGISRVPELPSQTRQHLEFEERSFNAYLVQLIGEGLSIGARYRFDDACYQPEFPDIPAGAIGLDQIAQREEARLQQVSLALTYQHPRGFFAQWESAWYQQRNQGSVTSLPGDNFWQHGAWTGWRFPRREVEFRVGVLNLTGNDYHLNPLNLYNPLPRHRTAVVSLRLSF